VHGKGDGIRINGYLVPMDLPLVALVWLHVSGNLVWIGSILAVGLVLASGKGEPKTRGEIASDIYRRLAVPAFVVSFLCGAIRLGSDLSYYLKQHHWMHGKLLLAVVVIALHHVIGARARKMAGASVQDPGPAGILTAVLAVAAIGAAFFAIFKVPS
jgi:putative membrane protein